MNRLLLTSALWFIGFMLMTALSPTDPISCCPWCPPPPPEYPCDVYPCCPPEVAVEERLEAVVGQPVFLKGGVSFYYENKDLCIQEKEALVFAWEQVGGPSVALVDADRREAYFVPPEPGEYSFRFQATYPVTEVHKSEVKSEWAQTDVTVREVVCGAPRADAGADMLLSGGPGDAATAILDGSGSAPALEWGCRDLDLIRHQWAVVSQPPGSDVTVAGADQAQASVDLEVTGNYEFRLEVQDNGGSDGRVDADADTVGVTLAPPPVCGAELSVTVTAAYDGSPIAGSQVTVVDADGVPHTADADAGGVAAFDNLAAGRRRSITAACDQTVPPLPGVRDYQRPRFETTTVLDHCGAEITIPLRLSASGEAARLKGTITAKVPNSLFDMLPHSFKCAGKCRDNDDCPDTYYCEPEDFRCKNLCTPRSLLPFFSLGDSSISAQFRFVMLFPVFPLDDLSSFPLARLLAPPPTEEAFLPGNLATDDTFLNGLAPTLGLDPWGESCANISDCPNSKDYVCEQDPYEKFLCKDRNPLRNIRMDLPAEQDVRLALIAGIMDIDMSELLSRISPWLQGEGTFEHPTQCLFSSATMHTLMVCPLTVGLPAGGETEITEQLAALTTQDCWTTDYQARETVVPVADPVMSAKPTCVTDADCGWVGSGRMCLPDPLDPGARKCLVPLFRVEVSSINDLHISASASGFHPTAARADQRLCSWIPEDAQYEQLCRRSDEDYYLSCDPPVFHDLEVPEGTECPFAYGLSIAALDFPPGHARLPAGGRVVVGYEFNRTPMHDDDEPTLLVPSLASNGLQGAEVRAARMYFRSFQRRFDGRLETFPGLLGAAAGARFDVGHLELPEFTPIGVLPAVPDAGIQAAVTFILKDPTVFPPEILRAYAVAEKMLQPPSIFYALPGAFEYPEAPGGDLIGLLLTEVYRDRPDYFQIRDPLWRIYAPAGTTSIVLPEGVSPFSPGDEIWVRFWSDSILDGTSGRQAAHAQDSYPLLVP